MSFKIKADQAKNRLIIKLEGFMLDEELKEAANTAIKETEKLKPGFSLINDVTTFKPATPKGVDEITRVQKYAHERGMGHVVRVVGDGVLNSMQFKRTQNAAGYIADQVKTLEEAEKMLDKEEARTRSL